MIIVSGSRAGTRSRDCGRGVVTTIRPMSGRIRLLIAAQPLEGGVPHHVLDVVHGLPSERFEIRVACPPQSATWRALVGRADVQLTPISPARGPAPGDIASLRTLSALVRHADVVHAHSSKAGFLARLAAALWRRTNRVAFTPHAWSFWAGGPAERALYVRLERLAARWCATIVAVSEAERAAGVQARVGRAEQYAVVPNGIELARYTRAPNPVPGRIVMVGRLHDPKRPDLAIRALVKVREAVPQAELLLVGDGPQRAALADLAATTGVRDSVRFLGDRSDVPDLLRAASVFVLATQYESWPLTVMEAMAAGVPVVASRVGGIPEMVEDGRSGVLVPPDDLDALSGAVRSLLTEPSRARAMGAAGQEAAARRFDRSTMAGSLVGLYEQLAASARGTPAAA